MHCIASIALCLFCPVCVCIKKNIKLYYFYSDFYFSVYFTSHSRCCIPLRIHLVNNQQPTTNSHIRLHSHRLRQESELLSRSSSQQWSSSDLQSSASTNNIADNNSSGSTSSTETLKWLGSMSDVSVSSHATNSSHLSGTGKQKGIISIFFFHVIGDSHCIRTHCKCIAVQLYR